MPREGVTGDKFTQPLSTILGYLSTPSRGIAASEDANVSVSDYLLVLGYAIRGKTISSVFFNAPPLARIPWTSFGHKSISS